MSSIVFLLTVFIDQLTDVSLSIIIVPALLILAIAYFFSSFALLPEKENNGLSRFLLKRVGYGSFI